MDEARQFMSLCCKPLYHRTSFASFSSFPAYIIRQGGSCSTVKSHCFIGYICHLKNLVPWQYEQREATWEVSFLQELSGFGWILQIRFCFIPSELSRLKLFFFKKNNALCSWKHICYGMQEYLLLLPMHAQLLTFSRINWPSNLLADFLVSQWPRELLLARCELKWMVHIHSKQILEIQLTQFASGLCLCVSSLLHFTSAITLDLHV